VVFQLLSQKGFRLFNQAVLLKGVNDCAQILADLSGKLFDSHIVPYYLHRLDKVRGAAHFDLPPEESCSVYNELRRLLPGYMLPAMVDDIPGKRSKSPVNC
jgi:L-lysine 2,3-aminomutase